MFVHKLSGCTPAPLANYLQAIGVLRLVSEQVDDQARGFWKDEEFVLVTKLNKEELCDFFLNEYSPTPMISPWNGGSGFYPKDTKSGIEAIRDSTTDRFEAYRAAIKWGFDATSDFEKRPEKNGKVAFVKACRGQWSDSGLSWLNAALAAVGDDVKFPALLGSGGNDGRLDFTNNLMQRLTELLLKPSETSRTLLEGALFDELAHSRVEAAIGQYHPGSAGGMNGGAGFSGKKSVNPWNFVLMLEGAVAFEVAVVRQLDSDQLPNAAAPFAMRSRAIGFGSAARAEESPRGEQWMPLWPKALRYNELQQLLRQGRMLSSGGAVKAPLQAAKALGAHGVSAGISEFQRFGFIERNGLANLAVPLGRWKVKRSGAARLLEEIEGWVERLRSSTRESHAPASLRRQVRRIETRMMQFAQNGTTRATQDLLISLGNADAALLQRPKHTKESYLRPLWGLSSQWAERADDGSVEFRLASALASLRMPGGKRTLRSYIVPVGKFPNSFSDIHVPRVVYQGHSLTEDLVSIVQRRSIEMRAGGSDEPQASRVVGKNNSMVMGFQGRQFVTLDDVQAYLHGQVDEKQVARLLRGLIAVKLEEATSSKAHVPDILPAYALVRCALNQGAAGSMNQTEVIDPGALSLLAGGQTARAGRLLARRLTSRGVRPRISHIIADKTIAKRLVASLLFPISYDSVVQLVKLISYPKKG